MRFTRITTDPSQMGGVACIRGLRIPVATVVGMIAEGIADNRKDLTQRGLGGSLM